MANDQQSRPMRDQGRTGKDDPLAHIPGWRGAILREAAELETRLYRLPRENLDPLQVVRTQAAIDRARQSARQAGGISGVVRRSGKSEARGHLEAARVNLARLAGTPDAPDAALAEQKPGESSTTDQRPSPAGDTKVEAPSTPERRLGPRNGAVLVGSALGVIIVAALIGGNAMLREVIGLGAAGGLIACVPSFPESGSTPPYYSRWLFVFVKIVAGAAVAVAATLLLHKGFGPLEPATGRAAMFYALVFGFLQHLLVTGPLEQVSRNRSTKPLRNPQGQRPETAISHSGGSGGAF